VARPNRRALGLTLGGFVLVLVGSNVQAGWILVLAALLIGAVATGLLLPRSMVAGISVERHDPEAAFAGVDVSVDLVVRNERRAAKLSVLLEDANIAPARLFLPHLAPDEEITLTTVRRAPRRGVYEGEPVRLSSSAPFGVARAIREVPAPGRVVIYPRVVRIPRLPEPDGGRVSERADTTLPRRGSGQDFMGVREYRAGDSLRHVHWPSSAHTGDLMVREFAQERPRRLGIVLDTSADGTFEGDGVQQTVLYLACSVSASLALAAMQAGLPVQLVAAHGGTVEAQSGGGIEILTWLAELWAPGGVPPSAVLDEAGVLLDASNDDAVVLPTWRGNAALEILAGVARLARGGAQVMVFIVDAHSVAARHRTVAEALSPGEVPDLVRALDSGGATVFRVREREDLATCLTRPVLVAS